MTYIKFGKIASIAIASTLGVLSQGLSAQAASLMPGNISDAQFNQLMTSGQFSETFVTSSRIGGKSTYELGILDPQNNLAPDQEDEFAWVSGDIVNFSLAYDGSDLTYSVGGQTLSTTAFSGPVTDLFLRTRAADNSAINLSNLMITDDTGALSLGSSGSAGMGGTDVDYLQIGDVTGAFTLTGESVMTWDSNDPPKQSELIFQIKAGPSQSVPEPTSLAAIALFGAAGLKLRRRKG